MASPVPESPDALLTRDQAAAALTAAGFPVKPKTLSTKASRGGGPPYRLFGSTRALYRWRDALAWAEARLSAPIGSTSEADAHQRAVMNLLDVENVARALGPQIIAPDEVAAPSSRHLPDDHSDKQIKPELKAPPLAKRSVNSRRQAA